MSGVFEPAPGGLESGYEWRGPAAAPAGFYRLRGQALEPEAIWAVVAMNRLAYGPTPDLLERVLTGPAPIGAEAFIAEPLAPETIPDALDAPPPPPEWQFVSGSGADQPKLLDALTRGHQVPHPERDNRPLLFGTGAGLANSIEALRAIGLADNEFFVTDGTTHLFPIDSASNQKGFSSSTYEFFRNLKVAAQILAHTDAVVAGTQLEGFDTHGSQDTLTGIHARLLSYLGWGFYAVRQFLRGVDPQLWEDTVVVTFSEFGLTSVENGSQGTDHAEASAMFVAGGRVRGGVYQCDQASWPVGPARAQFSVDRRYLGRTVDYRSVLGEIIRKHLGASPEALARILPSYAAEYTEHLQAGGVAPDSVRIVGELGLL